jgi:hypothetical protein
MFRRHLQMGVDEVKSLPWWQKRMYLEGLVEEFGDPEDVPVDVTSPDALAAAGLGVTVVGP